MQAFRSSRPMCARAALFALAVLTAALSLHLGQVVAGPEHRAPGTAASFFGRPIGAKARHRSPEAGSRTSATHGAVHIRAAAKTDAHELAGARAAEPLIAAPVILNIFAAEQSPSRSQVGQTIVISVTGLANPVRVFFSNGTTTTVEATPVAADLVRGLVVLKVPAGAATGNLKVRANGIDSGPWYFRVDPGTFTPGANAVTGQVTGSGAISGAVVLLLKNSPCEGQTPWDFATTDGTGHYTVHGGAEVYYALVFPPIASGRASGAVEVDLSGGAASQDVALSVGTTVTGRVVDADSPTTGVAHARVEFEGDGPELILSDGSGNFSAHLLPGDWGYRITPPPSSHFAWLEGDTTVGAGSPQSLGNLGVSTGVKISGSITRASDGSPLAGAEIRIRDDGSSGSETDVKQAAGDGSYAVYVPANAGYYFETSFDDTSEVVDVGSEHIAVAAVDQVVDVAAPDAAIISGIVTDLPGGAPIDRIDVQAGDDPMTFQSAFRARTCADGAYRLRVVPSKAGYIVGTSNGEDDGPEYASKVWNDTPAGSYYACEATPVAAATAGAVTSGIDFQVPQAVSVQGQISTDAAKCGDSLSNLPQPVIIDDGTDHGCSMGASYGNQGGSGYQIVQLPPSSVVASLRACLHLEGYDPQCYNHQAPPAFDPITIAAGGSANNVDFCLAACTPTSWYADSDGDGFGDPDSSQLTCGQPDGTVANSDDCNDSSAEVHPGATEVCANGRDDDCDGSTDEAGCASICPDNDADGYAVCGVPCARAGGSVAPGSVCGGCFVAPGDVCGDCYDENPSAHPGASDANCNGVDEDCSGTPDQDFVPSPTTCGLGPCASTGSTSCIGGVPGDSCVPGAAGSDDANCNAVDDDCDGSTDEEFAPQATLCGVGACARTGATSCVGGFVFDSCAVGAPSNEVCDGKDDDCDGTVDNPCSQLLTPSDLAAVSGAALPQSFTWTVGSRTKFVVQFSSVADFSVIRMKSWTGYKVVTAWTPSLRKWTKITSFGTGGAPIYWRVVGKARGLPALASRVYSFTIAP